MLFSLAGLKAQAQDVIMTRDYSVVNALVSEIGDDYVTYKAFDNQGGPNIKISTKNVFKITFQNGSEQFSTLPERWWRQRPRHRAALRR